MNSVLENRLGEKAHSVRKDVARMYYRAGWGHLAPTLSCTDILTAIFFGEKDDGEKIFRVGQDHFVLSKGHGCAALYVCLAEVGLIEREELSTFYQDNSRLIGLASHLVEGIDIPTGSLGHGICFATGTALAAKIDRNDARTFVILGDGESQEGSVWEAAEFAGSNELNNLIVILDRNGLQASDRIDAILPDSDIAGKWTSFGWNVIETDGHDYSTILEAVSSGIEEPVRPTIIIAHTIKGRGISIAENRPEWHSRAPKGIEWESVCAELGMSSEELERI